MKQTSIKNYNYLTLILTMIQTIGANTNPKNIIKKEFRNFFYQIGQDRYNTSDIKELSINYRNLTKDLDELGRTQQEIEKPQTRNIGLERVLSKASENWKCKSQIYTNKNEMLAIYINRIEQITKQEIPIDKVLILDQYNSETKFEREEAIKLAGILTGTTKFEILDEIESRI
ncbi:MAG: hypothetical protein HRU03_00250 [Nanoarchaeales archaeon]|nr:hypothetical protein [Nanoarchaeales archaeon]